MMYRRLSALLGALWCGCLLPGLAGCSRPAAVGVSAEPAAAAAEEPITARAQAPDPEPEPAPEPPARKQDEFRFPDDRGGQLLARVLSPADAGSPRADRATQPQPLPPPAAPDLPPPPPRSKTALPRLPSQRANTLRPRLILEETLNGSRRDPVPPFRQTLPAGDRIRVSSPDVTRPLPLPTLARPAADRAPLDDATGDASTAAALAAPLPRRTAPAPFLRLTLPDPYEHRRPLGVSVPAEPAAPAASSPRPPK